MSILRISLSLGFQAIVRLVIISLWSLRIACAFCCAIFVVFCLVWAFIWMAVASSQASHIFANCGLLALGLFVGVVSLRLARDWLVANQQCISNKIAGLPQD